MNIADRAAENITVGSLEAYRDIIMKLSTDVVNVNLNNAQTLLLSNRGYLKGKDGKRASSLIKQIDICAVELYKRKKHVVQ